MPRDGQKLILRRFGRLVAVSNPSHVQAAKFKPRFLLLCKAADGHAPGMVNIPSVESAMPDQTCGRLRRSRRERAACRSAWDPNLTRSLRRGTTLAAALTVAKRPAEAGCRKDYTAPASGAAWSDRRRPRRSPRRMAAPGRRPRWTLQARHSYRRSIPAQPSCPSLRYARFETFPALLRIWCSMGRGLQAVLLAASRRRPSFPQSAISSRAGLGWIGLHSNWKQCGPAFFVCE
jgi:hypothetical protein